MSGEKKAALDARPVRKVAADRHRGADSLVAEEAFSKVLQLVRQVQVGMQNIDPSHGLSGSQLWALWHISASPGQRVSELAATLHIHLSTASNLLDKLETRGLVRRERRDADNRVVRLYLSQSGDMLIKSVPGPMQGQLRRALREIPPPVLTGLIDGVSAVLGLMLDSRELKPEPTGGRS